jgi:hypothetical protein
VKLLLQQGANPATRHPSGQSLREIARTKGHHEIAALLEQRIIST